MGTNEMALLGPETLQFPRGFVDRDRTSETAKNAKLGLCRPFVSFYPNLAGKGSVKERRGFSGCSRLVPADPFGVDLGKRCN